MQELAANGIEAHAFQLADEVVGRGAIVRPIATGLDCPGPRDGGIETLVEGRLAALVPQDVAVDAERRALVAVALGIARGLTRVERKLADVRLEAAGDAGGGDLAIGRPHRHAGAGGREQPAEPAGQPMPERGQVCVDLLEQRLAQAVLLQQMAEVQDRRLVG